MNRFRFKLPSDDPVRLYGLGDAHDGISMHLQEEWSLAFDRLRRDKHAYCIGMGDYSEFRKPDDKFYDAKLATATIQEQVRRVQKRFDSVKGQVIGLLIGNHEEDITRKITYDPYIPYCEDRGFSHLGRMAMIEFVFPCGKTYNVMVAHGHGNGGSKGGEVNRVEKMLGEFDCDLYMQGHNHHLGEGVRTEITFEHGVKRRRYKQWLFTGSFLDGHADNVNSYVERSGGSPRPVGYGVAELSPEGIEAWGEYL